jgi:hypothetical protein
MSILRPASLCVSVVAVAALVGCTGNQVVITTSQQESRSASAEAQNTADQYRRAGAGDAAGQAQARADKHELEAKRKPESVLERVVDTLFSSWIASSSSGAPSSRR